jgi:hypothetical protein
MSDAEAPLGECRAGGGARQWLLGSRFLEIGEIVPLLEIDDKDAHSGHHPHSPVFGSFS